MSRDESSKKINDGVNQIEKHLDRQPDHDTNLFNGERKWNEGPGKASDRDGRQSGHHANYRESHDPLPAVSKPGNLAFRVHDNGLGEIFGKLDLHLPFQSIGKSDQEAFLIVKLVSTDIARPDVAFKRYFEVGGKFPVDVRGDLLGRAVEHKLRSRLIHS